MIEVVGLTKKYHDFFAVNGVSFSAQKGEIVGFLGPNGAGKTTTIRMLSTYLPPSSGTATIAGYDIAKQADKVRQRIGYLPETPPLYDELTVTEYLVFVARLKQIPVAKIADRVKEVEQQCFLEGMTHRLCGHLSKGYRQRVGLAQAIIGDPDVIILDEPTSGLDPKQIIEIRSLIKELGKKKTVLLSTHILPEVSSVCSKVVIVNQGKVVLEGSIDELTKDKPLEQLFLETVNFENLDDDSSRVSSPDISAVA